MNSTIGKSLLVSAVVFFALALFGVNYNQSIAVGLLALALSLMA